MNLIIFRGLILAWTISDKQQMHFTSNLSQMCKGREIINRHRNFFSCNLLKL
jgi:hypothetical protein